MNVDSRKFSIYKSKKILEKLNIFLKNIFCLKKKERNISLKEEVILSMKANFEREERVERDFATPGKNSEMQDHHCRQQNLAGIKIQHNMQLSD